MIKVGIALCIVAGIVIVGKMISMERNKEEWMNQRIQCQYFMCIPMQAIHTYTNGSNMQAE